MKDKLVILCGPTGTGKTSLAIKLCQKFGGEIISADSRQVYVGADIGTNKILNLKSKISNVIREKGSWIQDGVRIHLYDVVEPNENYSAGRFVKEASAIICDLRRRQKLPFVVGGTGFYMEALLGEVQLTAVAAQPQLRRELAKQPLAELQDQLKKLNPQKFQGLNQSDHSNPRRLIRAIEIELAGRFNLTKGRGRGVTMKRIIVTPGKLLKIGLKAPRSFLFQKANQWAKQIIKNGLTEETQTLLNKGYSGTLLLQGMIYQPTVEYLQGRIKSEPELTQKIQNQLHGYIRRQLTWFKKDKKIKWLDITASNFDKQAEKLVESLKRENSKEKRSKIQSKIQKRGF